MSDLKEVKKNRNKVLLETRKLIYGPTEVEEIIEKELPPSYRYYTGVLGTKSNQSSIEHFNLGNSSEDDAGDFNDNESDNSIVDVQDKFRPPPPRLGVSFIVDSSLEKEMNLLVTGARYELKEECWVRKPLIYYKKIETNRDSKILLSESNNLEIQIKASNANFDNKDYFKLDVSLTNLSKFVNNIFNNFRRFYI